MVNANKISGVSGVAEGWLMSREPTEPAEQMRIPAQLRRLAKPREGDAEIGEEGARARSIRAYRVGPKGESERVDLCFKDFCETGFTASHERCEESKVFRFSMARAYSRQTSCGASSTYSKVVEI